LALTAETGFLLFKEQVPLKFKKEISAVQCERESFQLILLSTPVSVRWTVPLIGLFKCKHHENAGYIPVDQFNVPTDRILRDRRS
jgi:hypothetical protein